MKLHHIEVHKTKKGTYVAMWVKHDVLTRWWTGREASLVMLKQGKGWNFHLDSGPLNDWKADVAAQAVLAVLRKPTQEEPYRLNINAQPFLEVSDWEAKRRPEVPQRVKAVMPNDLYKPT